MSTGFFIRKCTFDDSQQQNDTGEINLELEYTVNNAYKLSGSEYWFTTELDEITDESHSHLYGVFEAIAQPVARLTRYQKVFWVSISDENAIDLFNFILDHQIEGIRPRIARIWLEIPLDEHLHKAMILIGSIIAHAVESRIEALSERTGLTLEESKRVIYNENEVINLPAEAPFTLRSLVKDHWFLSEEAEGIPIEWIRAYLGHE